MAFELSEVIPGVWRGSYTTPTAIRANCHVLRLGDGEILVVSPPVGATDADFAAFDALGKVVGIVAPNTGHDLGLLEWQNRYPSAAMYAPSAAIPGITKAKPGLRPFAPLAELAARLPPGVRFVDVDATKSGLTMFAVEAGDQRALFVDELVGNSNPLSGPAPVRFAFWLSGSGPGIARNRIWTWVFAADKKRVAQQVLAEIDAHPPTVVLVGHGDPITGDAAAVVRAQLTPIA